MGPSDVQDHLAYDSANDLFSLPDLPNLLEGITLSEEDQKTYDGNLDVFRTVLERHIHRSEKSCMDLFDATSKGFLNMKNLLTFYFLLAGHNDAVKIVDIRQKLSPMFNSVVQRALGRTLGDSQSTEDLHKNSTGLFGGIAIIKSTFFHILNI